MKKVLLCFILSIIIVFFWWSINNKLHNKSANDRSNDLSDITEINIGKSKNNTVVSMSSLLNSPEKFDNADICISGILNIAFETNCIFVSAEDYEESNLDNAIKLEIDFVKLKTNLSTLMGFNGKYVTIEGTYHSMDNYPFAYFGVIDNINNIRGQ